MLKMNTLSRILAMVFAVLLVSCGSKEEKKKGFEYQESEEPAASSSQASKSDETSNDIVITGNDLMKFNLNEIKVKAGQKVKITLKHVGKLDKKVMGHNFVLLAQGTDMSAFALEAASAVDNDYIPANTTSVIAHTKIIGGGETDVIEFDAPAAGTYDFICSFPGHFAMMQGKFIVE